MHRRVRFALLGVLAVVLICAAYYAPSWIDKPLLTTPRHERYTGEFTVMTCTDFKRDEEKNEIEFKVAPMVLTYERGWLVKVKPAE